MGNQVSKLEDQQATVTKQVGEIYPQLDEAYKRAENMINAIQWKRAQLAKLNKSLWITIVIFAILIIGLIAIGKAI